jgi:hypothetical protein
VETVDTIDEQRIPHERHAPPPSFVQLEAVEMSDVPPRRRAPEREEHAAPDGLHAGVEVETELAEIVVGELPPRASAELLSRLLEMEDVDPSARSQTPQLDESELVRASVTERPTGHTAMPNAGQPNAQHGDRAAAQQSRQSSGQSRQSSGDSVAAPARSDGRGRRAGAGSGPTAAAEFRANFTLGGEASARLRSLAGLAPSARHGVVPLGAEFRASEAVIWLAELAGRAGSVVRDGLRFSASTRAGDASELLREQWALTLQGETAPVGLLSTLAAGERGEATAGARLEREKARAASAGAAAEVPTAPDSASPDFAARAAGPWPSATRAPHTIWESARDINGGARAASEALSPARAHAHQWPEGANTDVSSHLSTDCRSSPAPELPPLLPAQATTEAVLPVAVAATRQGARAEAQGAARLEESTTGDLDLLAEKIKLILDEQARRHGIDV